jgi:hypothetical protein
MQRRMITRLFDKLYRRIGRMKYKGLYVKSLGAPVVATDGETSLVSYYRDGKLDYATYKAVQQAGNLHKINLVSANEAALVQLATAVEELTDVKFILCHGTRNGAEQRYFRSVFPKAMIIGTEISDTALQFPDTIQWDFHEVKPEWIGRVDLLYSNSWDHTYDPKTLFGAWGRCISPQGVMALEHTQGHMPDRRAVLDPFGATVEGLEKTVCDNSSLQFVSILKSSDFAKDRKFLLFRQPPKA